MYTFLMIIFILLCITLTAAVLIQQGKGDLGLGSIGRGGQTLFGGSGGADFLEKVTWVLGALFMLGALGLALVKTRGDSTRLTKFDRPAQQAPAPKKEAAPAAAQPKPEAPTKK